MWHSIQSIAGKRGHINSGSLILSTVAKDYLSVPDVNTYSSHSKVTFSWGNGRECSLPNSISDHSHFIPRTIALLINHSASHITIHSGVALSSKYHISHLKYWKTDVFFAEKSLILCRRLDFWSFCWCCWK